MGGTLHASKHMTSYCTELMVGLRGHLLANKNDINHAKQFRYSEPSIPKLTNPLTPRSLTVAVVEPEADLILVKHHICQSILHPPQLIHVKAHQDDTDTVEFEDLPIEVEAHLNVICDINTNLA